LRPLMSLILFLMALLTLSWISLLWATFSTVLLLLLSWVCRGGDGGI
jgi:hypothetical protein